MKLTATIKGIGIDIVEVKRFARTATGGQGRFLANNYTKEELSYCFSFRDPRPHLAGTFAAKEAVYKALGRPDVAQASIEIRREKSGRPMVWVRNRRSSSVLVSISHTAATAVAVAVRQ